MRSRDWGVWRNIGRLSRPHVDYYRLCDARAVVPLATAASRQSPQHVIGWSGTVSSPRHRILRVGGTAAFAETAYDASYITLWHLSYVIPVRLVSGTRRLWTRKKQDCSRNCSARRAPSRRGSSARFRKGPSRRLSRWRNSVRPAPIASRCALSWSRAPRLKQASLPRFLG